MTELNRMNECYFCAHKYEIPNNAHIGCGNPSPAVEGKKHGIKNGWFEYPHCFDPVWKETSCPNFKKVVENDDYEFFTVENCEHVNWEELEGQFAIRFNPKPIKHENGSETHSLSFYPMVATCMLKDQEQVLKEVCEVLNKHWNEKEAK